MEIYEGETSPSVQQTADAVISVFPPSIETYDEDDSLKDHSWLKSKFIVVPRLDARMPGDTQFCWHWNVGACGYGNECRRAAWHHPKRIHHPIERSKYPFYFYLLKVPREVSPLSLLRRTLELNGMTICKDLLKCNLLWTNHFPLTLNAPFPEGMMINHFPGSYQITHKDNLAKNLMPLAFNSRPQLNGKEEQQTTTRSSDYSFLPASFVLPDQLNQLVQFSQRNIEQNNNIMNSNNNNNSNKEEDTWWIFKPAGLGEGRGITLNNIVDPTEFENLNELVIAQQYIRNPLTIQNYKIDLRIYVLLTSATSTTDNNNNSNLELWLFDDGLARFASSEYSNDVNTINNTFIHLCNNSVNRAANNSVNSTNWTVQQLRTWLLEHSSLESWDIIKDQLRHIASNTLYAISDQLVQGYQSWGAAKKLQCFELYGFDILVDSNFKCWLLEVNSLPDLACTSKNGRKTYDADFNVKAKLLSDLFSLLFYLRDENAPLPVPQSVAGGFELL